MEKTILDSAYVKRQLIAYIGNKRSILPFFYNIFTSLGERKNEFKFIDPFAGSGSVSRLARLMGYKVYANDWEFYSKIINTCFLGVEKRDLCKLFDGHLEDKLKELNAIFPVNGQNPYIAKYYAPGNMDNADYRTERMFYSVENAQIIDMLRNKIEEWYPGFDLDEQSFKEKSILLSVLLYNAATHTNTSGVFKACHKGFGGHGKDALSRILKKIQMVMPELINAKHRSEVFSMDANDFVSKVSGDLCYLDPPYTGHQYGSNYHLLNTIALWDKPKIDNSIGSNGKLKEKAAIRKDWIKTRSFFCYKDTAYNAFKELIDNIDCRYIALSYNSEGIVPFDELYELFAENGNVTLVTNDYIKYRGGRQSVLRQNYNIELLLLLERGRRNSYNSKKKIDRILIEKKIKVLMKQSFYPRKIKQVFSANGNNEIYFDGNIIPMNFYYEFNIVPDFLSALMHERLKELYNSLLTCACTNRKKEIDIVVRLLRNNLNIKQRKIFSKKVLWLLKKFAFKKYKVDFILCVSRIKELIKKEPINFKLIENGLYSIEDIAYSRFIG
jgi:adenine-specific DNA-methyltransferase